MLTDLLLLEDFYGRRSCDEFFESLSKRHGLRCIREAASSGDVRICMPSCASAQSTWLISLTPQGREKAQV